jgi:SAM-dependent methyltransferase
MDLGHLFVSESLDLYMAFPSWLPLGLGIKEYYKSRERTVIKVHTVDGEITPYPAELFFREYDDFGVFDELACHHARGTVLDVGAGAGCISLFLEGMGLQVTAIEIARDAVDVMEAQGLKDARCGDFFELNGGEQWDTILLMMNGIGFVGKLDGLDRFLAKAKGLLKPGGQVLFDSSDLALSELAAEDFTGAESTYRGEVWYQLEYKGIKGAPYYWLYIDQQTMQGHAEAAGFRFELLDEAEDGYYLARLTLLQP